MVSLIDTDVMIDLSRGNADAADCVDSLSDPAISIVTAQELIVGARDKRDLTAIDSLVSMYRVIHMGSNRRRAEPDRRQRDHDTEQPKRITVRRRSLDDGRR
jgi:predicted nucleic acid-binding protein